MLLLFGTSQQDAEVIENKLFEFDKIQGLLQERTQIHKNYVIKDAGTIIAGINTNFYHWGMLYVDVLFVDEQNLNTLKHCFFLLSESSLLMTVKNESDPACKKRRYDLKLRLFHVNEHVNHALLLQHL